MAFKKGISGNPGGRSGEKIFTDALRLELNRIDPNDKEKRKKVNRLAEKLVECAIEDKQSWAFQQIADRLAGKPVQVVDATVEDHRTVHEFSSCSTSKRGSAVDLGAVACSTVPLAHLQSCRQ